MKYLTYSLFLFMLSHLALLSNNEKLTSRFGNDYVNQNNQRESGLYNCFHEKNREIIFSVILSDTDIKISFTPVFQNTPLSLESEEGQTISDSIDIETFKCYISNVRLYDGEQVVFKEENSYHLLDASDSKSLQWLLPITKAHSFSHIQFNIGIDSLTNSSGAFGGDLDPTNGMYWTWQSGYINFKLEGTASNCPARQNRFQFHLGGYQGPYNTLQEVRLKVNQDKEINIQIAIDVLLSQIDLKTEYQIMSPNEEAMKIANRLPDLFTVKQ
ncbi:MAG: hypothetical protein ACI956_000525 [Nonlabens sp.]|jgi:hypothetical protein